MFIYETCSCSKSPVLFSDYLCHDVIAEKAEDVTVIMCTFTHPPLMKYTNAVVYRLESVQMTPTAHPHQ